MILSGIIFSATVIWIIITILTIYFLISYVLEGIAFTKIFSDAGIKKSKAWIPFYNWYKMYSLAWKGYYYIINIGALLVERIIAILEVRLKFEANSIFIFILFLCFIIIRIVGSYKIARYKNKGIGYAILLFLFKPVALLFLAYKKN